MGVSLIDIDKAYSCSRGGNMVIAVVLNRQ